MNEQPTFWIGTSWKMNKTLVEAMAFADGLAEMEAEGGLQIQRFVIPSFTLLREVANRLSGSSVMVGAQNMHWADGGPWTGEISPPMLKDCGVTIVELGHSERREHFGETDETIGLKVQAATRHGLTALVCVGETLAEREAGEVDAVLKRQVETALTSIANDNPGASILLAYEPVWAIGEGGTPASSQYANARQGEIIAIAEAMLGRPVPCLYGGSVNAENCEELIACPNINGLFVGRSAWSLEGYQEILARCAKQISNAQSEK